jgi:hypothetical protein
MGTYSYDRTVTLAQWLTTYSHPISLLGKVKIDIGGPFRSEKLSLKQNWGKRHYSKKTNLLRGVTYWVEGQSAVSGNVKPGSTLFPAISETPYDIRVARATQALARVQPAHPSADLGTFLGELRQDGIPHVIGHDFLKTRLRSYRALGGEYLNVEFGWKPFIRDLKKVTGGMISTHDKLEALRKQSGKPVHCSLQFDPETETTILPSVTPSYGDPPSSAVVQSAGTLYKTQRTTREQWLSAAFVFNIGEAIHTGFPILDGLHENVMELDHVLGLRPSPEVIWNVKPWTWLGDWFANVGAVMTNISESAFDGTIVLYAYFMEHTNSEIEYTLALPYKDGQYDALTQTFGREIKTRIKSSPFGFGFTAEDFTPHQWAVLGALGLTRSPGKLRGH